MLKYESKRIRFKKTELVYFFLEETTYEKTCTRVLHNKFFIILSITINKGWIFNDKIAIEWSYIIGGEWFNWLNTFSKICKVWVGYAFSAVQ